MLFAGIAVSCVPELDNSFIPEEGLETVEISVGFKMNEMRTKGMTSAEEDASLKDVWVLQFDGDTDAAVIVGKPRYYAIEDDASRIEFTRTDDCTVVFLANTHDAYLELSDVKTYGDIRNKMLRISDGADCYDPDMLDIVSSTVLYGVDFTDPDVAIQPALSRIYARIAFTLTDSCEEIDIHSVQLCNIPEKAEYLPHTLAVSEMYPSSSQSSRISYPSETFNGNSQTYFWYVPRNEQGISGSSTEKTKNSSAPAEATFIRVLGTDVDGTLHEYTLYPGADLVSDFNLKPNHAYDLSLNLKNAGDPAADSRVRIYGEETADVTSSLANCFMIKPSPYADGAKKIFSFYPHARVNQYWTDYNDIPGMLIGTSTSWTAELVWQDAAGLVKFIDASGNEQNTFSAVGQVPMKVAVANKGCGNAVVLVRNSQGTVLWSWHLWVTDYDPEYHELPQEGKFIYPVEGGAVHRYTDRKNGSSYWRSPNWYKDSYIMDRNLGAMTDGYPFSPTTGLTSGAGSLRGQLYYQWGRKDPFTAPASYVTLYDITGATVKQKAVQSATKGVAFATSIANPDTFYGRTGDSSNDWCAESPSRGVWNDATTVTNMADKSVYDPCPLGWAVPHQGIWEGFTNTRPYRVQNKSASAEESTILEPERDERLRWDYNQMPGCRFWPAGYEVPDNPIYYPATGGLSNSTGGISWPGTRVAAWSAQGPQFLDLYYPQYWMPVNGAVRSYGMEIRCIQVKE